MAIKKLNSMPDFTASIPKTPHDVSQSTGFTCPPGQISPVYFDMLHTGDEIHFSASMFARLNPLKTQALGEIEMHLDYFFVPLSVLYTPSTSMFYQTDDLISGIFNAPNSKLFDTAAFPVWKPLEKDGSQKTWFDKYLENVSRYTQDSFNADCFDCLGKSIFRMFDLLDMNPYALLGNNDGYPSFTPWFALAYQAIYNLHPGYRNFDRERKSYIYNIDYAYQLGEVYDQEWISGSDFYSIFSLHYIDLHKDYFQSVKVSPMGSAVSMLKDPGAVFRSVNNWLNNASFGPSGQTGDETISFGSDATQTTALESWLSTSNIRQLFMVDKLLRIIGRSEKNYESQFLAHYGIKIPHDDLHNITHIGHDMTVLSPSAVVSTADTYNSTNDQGSALGAIGGQGSQMLTGRKYNFKAPFHGVFMTLAYFKPRFRYQLGFNKLHQLNSILDFWQPEFDKKGMQPLFAYEAQISNSGTIDMTSRLGWQFAYEQFKRKSDRITWAFAPTSGTGRINYYSPWFISTRPFVPLQIDGSVVPSELPNVTIATMKVPTTALNGIMQLGYDPRWSASYIESPWLIYARDPFIVDFNMHCKKVNGMSEYGEPEL